MLKIKVIKLINRIKEIQKMYLAKTMFFLGIGKTPTNLFHPFSWSATNRLVGIDAKPIGPMIERKIVPDSLQKIVTKSSTNIISNLPIKLTLFNISCKSL